MSQAKKDITGGSTPEQSKLPFDRLLWRLRKEGFAVDVRNFSEFPALFLAIRPKTMQEMKYYLAPLVCTNEQEQRKFYLIFDEVFGEGTIVHPVEPKRLKRVLWIVAGLLILVGMIFGVVTMIGDNKPQPEQEPAVSAARFRLLVGSTQARDYKAPFDFTAIECFLKKSDTNIYTVSWDFGDGKKANGCTLRHYFPDFGRYYVLLRIEGKNNNFVDTAGEEILVCPHRLELKVDGPVRNGKEYVLQLQLSRPDEKRDSIPVHLIVEKEANGTVGRDSIPFAKNHIEYRWSGRESLHYYAVYSNLSYVGCTAPGGEVNAIDTVSSTLMLKESKDPQKTFPDVNYFVVWLLLLISLAFFGLAWHYWRKRNGMSVQTEAEIPPFDGMEGPYELPFLPKDQFIQRVSELSRIAYGLRRRTESGVPVLNIDRTIDVSVRNYGIVTPVYTVKQQPREYLFLIDASSSNSQQLFLFKYFIQQLANDSVLIDVYFFYHRPDRFFQEGNPEPLSISRLRDSHYRGSLVIVGNGYNFLSRDTAQVEPGYVAELEYWEKRVMVTPVPLRDWGGNERILGDFFMLAPADIGGWVQLVQMMTSETPEHFEIPKDWNTYQAKFLMSQDAGALKDYLSDNDLWQWLCALAVYHKIRWEVVIEIGKRILGAAGELAKLNYTNLLRLSRIGWMDEGQFPSHLRLDLLKQLTVENELLAREAMQALMKESDLQISAISFSFEEKEMQKYKDGFVLYANDPEKYRDYKGDSDRFLKLWDKDLIADLPLAEYLKNEREEWKTPVRSKLDRAKEVGIEEYIHEIIDPNPGGRTYLARIIAFAATGLLGMLVIIAVVFFTGTLSGWKWAQQLHLVSFVYPEKIDLYVNLEYDICLYKTNPGLRYTDWSLRVDSIVYKAKPLNNWDSALRKSGQTQNWDLMFNGVDLKSFKTKGGVLSMGGDIGSVQMPGEGLNRTHLLAVRVAHCNDTAKKVGVLYYLGSREDSVNVRARLLRQEPLVAVKFGIGPLTEPYANTLYYDRGMDSSMIYATAAAFVAAGIPIRKMATDSSKNSVNPAQYQVWAIADRESEKLPLLTVDSLKCRFLHQCGEAGISVSMTVAGDMDADSLLMVKNAISAAGYRVNKPVYMYRTGVDTLFNSIHYTRDNKPRADSLALILSRVLRKRIPVVEEKFFSSSSPVTVYIGPSTYFVKYSSVYDRLKIPFIDPVNPNSFIHFQADRFSIRMGNNPVSSYMINPNFKRTGDMYEFWTMEMQAQYNVNAYFDESGRNDIRLNPNNSVSILDSKGKRFNDYSLLFSFKAYSQVDLAPERDLGEWVIEKGDSSVVISYNSVYRDGRKRNGPLVIQLVMLDPSKFCRIYLLKDKEIGQQYMMLVYEGRKDKFISEIVKINIKGRLMTDDEFIQAWGNGVEFSAVGKLVIEDGKIGGVDTLSGSKIIGRLLWLDDQPARNRHLIDEFKRMGLVVDTVPDISEATRMTGQHTYQLIVTDIMKPGNVKETMQWVSRVRPNSPTVIVYTSAVIASANNGLFLKQGAAEVFVKESDLLSYVRAMFTSKK